MIQTAQRLRNHTGMVRGCDFFLLREEGEEERRVAAVLRRGFVEVKGVTLESGGHARFPDAPTERGVKHIEELTACRREGFEAYLCFVLQMAGMRDFSPNDETHPAFGEALRSAAKSGVEVLARECRVTPDTLEITGAVPILL